MGGLIMEVLKTLGIILIGGVTSFLLGLAALKLIQVLF